MIQDEGVQADLLDLNNIKELIKRNLSGRTGSGFNLYLTNFYYSIK